MAQDDLRVIVIGFTDQEGGDDAVGGVILSQLKTTVGQSCEFRVVEGSFPASSLAELPVGALVVFIDSIRNESPPGTVHCLRLPSKSARSRHLPEHEIEQMKVAGSAPRMFLIGVETDPAGTPGEISEHVQQAIAEIVRNFPRYLKLARDLTA